jgi:hypothetical protein
MATRRNFLKGVGAAGAGLTGASINTAANAADDRKVRYAGSHKMPTGLKLLSIKSPDGRETLGVVTDKGVIDVRAAAVKFGLVAPITLDDLLQEGNADGLNRLVAKARSSGMAMLDESKITHGRLFSRPPNTNPES